MFSCNLFRPLEFYRTPNEVFRDEARQTKAFRSFFLIHVHLLTLSLFYFLTKLENNVRMH